MFFLKNPFFTRRRGEASHTLFENRKKCPDFENKSSDCVYLCFKCSFPFKIKNALS